MNAQSANRAKAQQAFRLANDLLLDLVTGMQAHRFFSQRASEKTPSDIVTVGFNRLCLFHVIITLAKVGEFNKQNKDVLPLACRDEMKRLVKDIDQKGILKFRNSVVGHLYEKSTGKPLTLAEVDSRVESIIGGDLRRFFLWVNDGESNPYPTTVISVVERVRDLIRDEHTFTDRDLQ